MACGPCAARLKAASEKYEWTDGTNTVVYDTKAAAKAKVLRRGGSYKPVTPAQE